LVPSLCTTQSIELIQICLPSENAVQLINPWNQVQIYWLCGIR
jgi:hypothetical protein